MTRSNPRHRWISQVWPVAAAAALLVIGWQLIVSITNYPTYILPGPAVVLDRFLLAWSLGTIQTHAAATLTEIAFGLLVGGGLGLLIGLLLARSALAERLLSPYLVAAQATPILALAPLIYLWLGSGLPSRVLICSLIVFFPITVSTMVGVRSVDRRLVELARSLRATRGQVLRQFDPHRARPIEAIAEIHLATRGFLDLGVAMPQYDRAVRAHVIDVLVAIDVPNMRALAARKERRVGAPGEQQRSLMPVDSAGDDFLRALHQGVTVRERVGFHGNSCAAKIRPIGDARIRLANVSKPGSGIKRLGLRDCLRGPHRMQPADA